MKVCNTFVLPLKTKVKGPAPAIPSGQEDIIDEAIKAFRCNVLHKNFKQPGPADLSLCYLTVWIGEVIRFLSKIKSKDEAKKKITRISHDSNFSIPGDDNFCMPGFFSKPEKRADGDIIRSYLRQLREESATRLVGVLYMPSGEQNKWWFQFHKRTFMGIEST
eukprot:CAMPEP_0197515276 /NCGR_PEP_ID=MMETSP1318-20131121/455_1 /TAXON_ID=552666 /ORGANISM="Partenskyella glossopodia, Strain RCC365" /LENGTH=162 /DNA_ID=CAMNT_0043063597 /DNA_START=150 /DNA_END=638 /DNA_ORIENTATION=-